MLTKFKFVVVCAALFISLPACHKDKDDDDDDDDDESVIVTPKSDVEGVLVATISADSATDQTIQPSLDGDLGGVSVTFSPGSLAVSTDITVETGVDIANDAAVAQLGIEGTKVTEASFAVVVGSSAATEAVNPFTIALPLTPATALEDTGLDKIVIIYKVTKADGTISLGIIPTAEITIEGAVAKFGTKNFGVFQAGRSSAAVTAAKEIVTTSPVTSIAALKPFFGTWVPTCYSESSTYSEMNVLTIYRDGAYEELESYANDGCDGEPVASEKTYYVYSLGKEVATEAGAKETDISIIGGTLTALTDAQATKYNSDKFCGFTDWKKDVVKDIANKTCNGDVRVAVGKTYYTIVEIEDGKLYFGAEEAGHEGKTAATRNVTLFRDAYRVKQ